VLYNEGDGRFRPEVIAAGKPVLFARALAATHPDILAIRADAIVLYENSK
jgi:hypothetical protein